MSLPASNTSKKTSTHSNACSTASSDEAPLSGLHDHNRSGEANKLPEASQDYVRGFEAGRISLQQELKQTQEELKIAQEKLKQARDLNQSLSEQVRLSRADSSRCKQQVQEYEYYQGNITKVIVSVFNRCVESYPKLDIAKKLAEKELQDLMAIASAPDLTSMWLNKLLDELGAQAAKNIDLRRQRRNGNLSESNRHKTRKYQVEPEQDDVEDAPDVGTEDDGAEKSTAAKPKSTRKPVDTSKIYKLTPTFDEEMKLIKNYSFDDIVQAGIDNADLKQEFGQEIMVDSLDDTVSSSLDQYERIFLCRSIILQRNTHVSHPCPYCGKVHEFEIHPKSISHVLLTCDGRAGEIWHYLVPVYKSHCIYESDKDGNNQVKIDLRQTSFDLFQSPYIDLAYLPITEHQLLDSDARAKAYTDAVKSQINIPLSVKGNTSNALQKARSMRFRELLDQSKKHEYNIVGCQAFYDIPEDELVELRDGVKVLPAYSVNRYTDGLLPAFDGCSVSTNLLVNVWAYRLANATRNASYNLINRGIFAGAISAPTVVRESIAFMRGYGHQVVVQMQKELAEQCPSLKLDESPLKLRDLSRNSYIWAMSSGRTSPYQGTVFALTKSRSAEAGLEALVYPFPLQGKAIIDDGFSAYPYIVATAAGLIGHDITHANCWVHARRKVHEYLEASDQLSVYQEINGIAEQEKIPFSAAFAHHFAEHEAVPGGNQKKQAIYLYFLINTVFSMERKVVQQYDDYTSQAFKDALLEQRQKHIAPVVAQIFKLINLINDTCHLAEKTRFGRYGVTGVKGNKLAEAVVYWLNQEQGLKQFLEDPDIDLDNNSIENRFRAVTINKKVSMGFDSFDGAHAFCDWMSIMESCKQVGVDPISYMYWLKANMDRRKRDSMAELKAKYEQSGLGLTGIDFYKQAYRIPTKVKMELKETLDKDGNLIASESCTFSSDYRRKRAASKDSDGNTTTVTLREIDMYDTDNNPIVNDFIDMRGLTPYDYKQLLELESKKILQTPAVA